MARKLDEESLVRLMAAAPGSYFSYSDSGEQLGGHGGAQTIRYRVVENDGEILTARDDARNRQVRFDLVTGEVESGKASLPWSNEDWSFR